MAFTIITGGSFTSTGAGVKIPLPSSADYFKTWNITQITASNPNTVIEGDWFGSLFGAGASATGGGIKKVKTTADLTSAFTAGTGFTYVTTVPMVEAPNTNAITAISAANPAVVTQTNTYSNGDILRIYGTTGDLTIGGMTFQISSASGSGYTLLGLANVAGNGLAAATGGTTRRVSSNLAVDPEYLYITNISNATQAVVSTSVDPVNYYVVGMEVYLSVPSSFGMLGINGLTGTILAIDAVAASTNIGAYNMTLNINTSSFSAFAFPLTTLSPTAQLFATLSPAGASTQFNPITNTYTGYNFSLQPFHTGQFTPYMFLYGGAQSPAGANADVINWAAYKFEN